MGSLGQQQERAREICGARAREAGRWAGRVGESWAELERSWAVVWAARGERRRGLIGSGRAGKGGERVGPVLGVGLGFFLIFISFPLFFFLFQTKLTLFEFKFEFEFKPHSIK